MKKSILMRVLICKIHCPLICFCKPSAAHLYSSGPLKLENSSQPPSNSTVASISDTSDQVSAVTEPTTQVTEPTTQVTEPTTQVKDQNSDSDGKLLVQNATKSCIKKCRADPDVKRSTENKRVQWIDNIGKELVEIKEFESCETGDTDNEEDNKGCMCIIL